MLVCIRKEFNSYLYSSRTTYLYIKFSDKELMSICYRVSQGKVYKVSWLREMEGFKVLPEVTVAQSSVLSKL